MIGSPDPRPSTRPARHDASRSGVRRAWWRLAGWSAVAVAVAGLVAAGSRLEAQGRGHIEGTVIEDASGEPIDDALVKIEDRYRRTRTDSLGRFRFSSVPPGTYTIVASHEGHADASAPVDVEATEISSVELSLVRTGVGPAREERAARIGHVLRPRARSRRR